MIGFDWTVTKFFWYLFYMFFSLLYFTYYGMMTVAMTPNPALAFIFAASFFGIWNVFSGFLIPRPRMPIWWRWHYWVCPFAWTLYGLVTSHYGDNETPLDDSREKTVKQFLDSYFGFKHDFLGVVAGVIVGWAAFFGPTFTFSIKAFNFQQR